MQEWLVEAFCRIYTSYRYHLVWLPDKENKHGIPSPTGDWLATDVEASVLFV